MISTYSNTIRRKEMDAVLTCMVDEKIGPGILNERFNQQILDFCSCSGAVIFRTPFSALKYALRALNHCNDDVVLISALAPAWHVRILEALEYKYIVLDVDEESGLVNAEIVSQGIKDGGRLLLLHETMGILPNMNELTALGIPIIEDISQSAGAVFPLTDENGELKNYCKAGSFGVYTIMCLEEHDVITAGGGAVLIAHGKREWAVLKKITDSIWKEEFLPDINCALGLTQLKEFNRNEKIRKELFNVYKRACMSGRHKMFLRNNNSYYSRQIESNSLEEANDISFSNSTISCFPLILNTSFKEVKQYAAKKDIEVRAAYEESVISVKEEFSDSCIKAKSLYLRCALFPLYPRLTRTQTEKIVKVLSSLP